MQVRSLLEEQRDFLPNAANFAAFVHDALPCVNWAGFYFPTARGLLLGPFAGKPACVLLPKGRGVCGRAFTQLRTVTVPDVAKETDHIVCDAASKSELVVPLMSGGRPRGVFDVDSPEFDRFRDADATGIGQLVADFLEATDLPGTFD